MDQLSTEHLWQDYFKGPTEWWDNRNDKHNANSPDFRHKTTREALWIDNCKTPAWVKEALQKNTSSIGGFCFESDKFSHGAGRAGNALHKRWFRQPNKVNENADHMFESGNEFQLSETIALMDTYVKNGRMIDARHVFDNMPTRNVFSWNMIILGYAKQKDGVLALEMYARMLQEGIQPSEQTFVGALKACSGLAARESETEVDGKFLKVGCLDNGRAMHSQVVRSGFESNVFVGTTIVDMYSKCGSLEDAWHVFEKLHHRNVVSWNAMIFMLANKGEGVLALDLFAQMQQEGVTPDGRTVVGALKACSSLVSLEEGKQVNGKLAKIGLLEKAKAIHFQVIKSGFESSIYVGTTLVNLYAKCGSMEDARHVFDELSCRDVVLWTAMILGYAEQYEIEKAFKLYAQMQEQGLSVDSAAFASILNACGSIKDARHLFDEFPNHDVVSWNAMIIKYAKKDDGILALELYTQMQQEGIKPDDQTFVGVLKGCSSLAALEEGKRIDGTSVKLDCLEKGRLIHFRVITGGFESCVFVGTTLVDMYATCGSVEDARYVFDELRHHDLFAWTAMILGYAEQGQIEEAFKLYAQMQEQGLTADSVTFVGLVKACGNTAALKTGRELHAQICRVGLETTVIVANALIDMYAKCGSMGDAQHQFDALATKDVVTWTALMTGYARQGESGLVFNLFERLSQDGIQPNTVTFLSVLTACSHAGLVEQGQKYFHAMSKVYGIIPDVEHYNCMIDVLGRAGQVEEAAAMLEKVPLQPSLIGWLTLLGACQKWKNVEVGRRAFDYCVRLDKKGPGAYVLMSNIYADACMWEELNKIQILRKNAQAL